MRSKAVTLLAVTATLAPLPTAAQDVTVEEAVERAASSAIEAILGAIRLPDVVDEAREAGVSDSTLTGILDDLRASSLPAADAEAAARPGGRGGPSGWAGGQLRRLCARRGSPTVCGDASWPMRSGPSTGRWASGCRSGDPIVTSDVVCGVVTERSRGGPGRSWRPRRTRRASRYRWAETAWSTGRPCSHVADAPVGTEVPDEARAQADPVGQQSLRSLWHCHSPPARRSSGRRRRPPSRSPT